MPPVRPYIQDAWDRRHFVVAFAKADLRGPRSRTRLGELWAVADPLFQAAIYWFLITMIRSTPGQEANERLIILISGVFLFTFSSTVVSGGGRSIIRNKGLMLNSTFPRILLPATETYKGLLDLGPYLMVYAVIHLLLGGPVGPGLFFLPLLLVLQVMISAGLALIFATLTVFISDMSNILDYIMRVLFFTTPILYPVSMLGPVASTALQINPFFSLFACYQAVVTGSVPGAGYLFQATLWACGLLYAGFRIFVSREREFALRL
jgi:teichoic acid transport system permease protein